MFYDKPVIYFHCNESLSNVSVEVDINGDILVTIPQANITENGIGWNVDIVNNSVVAPDGTVYDYLFYEGQMNISQGVVAYVVLHNENVTFYVKNIAKYTISDIFFVYGKRYDAGMAYMDFYYSRDFCYIESLKSGEEKIVTSKLVDPSKLVPSSYTSANLNNNESLSEDIIQLLIKQGLTRNESVEFVDYWFHEWFTPSYKYRIYEYSHLIYTIPQDIYDSLLPLNISPEPDIIRRVGMFYVTDVPVVKNNSYKPQERVTVTTDKIAYRQGENVNINVNINSGSTCYLNYVGSECWRTWKRIGLEYYNGYSWVGVDFGEKPKDVPCLMWMPLGPELRCSSTSFNFSWCQKQTDIGPVSSGTYRFWLRSINYPGRDGDTIYDTTNLQIEYFYSNEFAII